MIDEDEVGLKEKPEDTRYIKIRREAPGVWAKDLIPNFAIIGNCRLRNGQVVTPWRILGGGELRLATYHGTVDVRETPVQGLPFYLKIIYNGPPSSRLL